MTPRYFARVFLLLSVAASALPLAAAPAAGSARDRSVADRIPGRYIVGYRNSVDRPGALSDRPERAEGFDTSLRYRHSLEGFAAELTPTQVQALRSYSRVAFVVPDREVHAIGTVPVASGDSAPTGIRRFEAATTTQAHEASSVNVAVIDTGIDLNHPDLDNAVNGKDCTGSEPAQDDNGHGTHVAGTIAAENDTGGVVGVAPGTTLYAVKVLNYRGSGSWSQVICGIDWVTRTRSDPNLPDIAVANMSLGGGGTPIEPCGATGDLMHQAICDSTAAGVTYVVAAGNSGWDFDYEPQPDVPAAYPEVLTVTAVSDSDGLPGGTGGAPSCRTSEADDRYASFSNYAATPGGQDHTVAAPGVCIKSDWKGGGTNTISGTSMATPHITGLVALCLGEVGTSSAPCAGMLPDAIIDKVRADAAGYNTSKPGYGFYGDPDPEVSTRYYGWLARVGMAPLEPPPPPPPPDGTPPTVTSVTPADGAVGQALTTNVSVTFSEAMNQASAQSAFSLTPSVVGTFSWSGNTMTFDPSGSLAQGTTYAAKVAATAADASGETLAAEHAWSFHTLTNVTAYPVGTTIEPEGGTLRAGDYSRLVSDNNSYYEVNSTTTGTRTTSWYGSFSGVANELSGLKATYKGRNTRSCTQTVAVWNWSTGSWTQIDSRTVGKSEVLVEGNPTGTQADYVSALARGDPQDGELRVLVRCTAGGNFYARGDLMKIAYVAP